jgi:hypothetical protein
MARPTDSAAGLSQGYRLPGLEKTIFQRPLAEREFSPDSIHNDRYTKQHGYPGALISAYVLAGYMSELMVEFFGSSWFTSGEISLRFVSPGVQQGDRVTCGASVREARAPGPGELPRVILDVWMEKADGTRPVLGTASAILSKPAGQIRLPVRHRLTRPCKDEEELVRKVGRRWRLRGRPQWLPVQPAA